MGRPRQAGSTGNTYYFLVRSKVSTPVGQGLTGLLYNTAGLKFSFTRDDGAAVPIALVAQTPTGAWTSGGFCLVDDVNAPGMVRLDGPDAASAAGVGSLRFNWTGANSIDDGDEIVLTAYDPLAAPSTTTIDDTHTKVTQLAADYTTVRAANLDALDAAVSSRLAASAYTAPPTAVQNADALLARNQKGGTNGPSGQTVADSLASGFLKFSESGNTLTVLNGDGTTAFTKTITRVQADAIVSSV